MRRCSPPGMGISERVPLRAHLRAVSLPTPASGSTRRAGSTWLYGPPNSRTEGARTSGRSSGSCAGVSSAAPSHSACRFRAVPVAWRSPYGAVAARDIWAGHRFLPVRVRRGDLARWSASHYNCSARIWSAQSWTYRVIVRPLILSAHFRIGEPHAAWDEAFLMLFGVFNLRFFRQY